MAAERGGDLYCRESHKEWRTVLAFVASLTDSIHDRFGPTSRPTTSSGVQHSFIVRFKHITISTFTNILIYEYLKLLNSTFFEKLDRLSLARISMVRRCSGLKNSDYSGIFQFFEKVKYAQFHEFSAHKFLLLLLQKNEHRALATLPPNAGSF